PGRHTTGSAEPTRAPYLRTCSVRPSGAVTKMLAMRRSKRVPAANPEALLVPWSVLPRVTANPRREQIDLEHRRRGRPQLLRHPVTSSTGPRPRGAPRRGRRGRADVHDEDRTTTSQRFAPRTRWMAQAPGNIWGARLMLRLDRGLGPLSGCRWFNAV